VKGFSLSRKETRVMVAKSKKKAAKKKGSKDRVKVLNLKRETIKDLSGGEKKKVKGGGGAGGGVVQSRTLTDM